MTSCFEPDDVIDNETSGYQNLLEDITSFDLYEDYDTLYHFPLRNLSQNLSSVRLVTHFYEDEKWLKESEEIISPYSPNTAYFRLVQELDVF